MEQAYAEWREIERDQEVELIRRTGLLCFSEEADNEHTSDVIKAFEATPGARFSTFYGKVFFVIWKPTINRTIFRTFRTSFHI